MGDKRLKAIAVYGTKDINVARPDKLYELSDQILKRSDKLRVFNDDISHTQLVYSLAWATYGNLERQDQTPEGGDINAEFWKKFSPRRTACYNCQTACKREYVLPGSKNSYVKCVSQYV